MPTYLREVPVSSPKEINTDSAPDAKVRFGGVVGGSANGTAELIGNSEKFGMLSPEEEAVIRKMRSEKVTNGDKIEARKDIPKKELQLEKDSNVKEKELTEKEKFEALRDQYLNADKEASEQGLEKRGVTEKMKDGWNNFWSSDYGKVIWSWDAKKGPKSLAISAAVAAGIVLTGHATLPAIALSMLTAQAAKAVIRTATYFAPGPERTARAEMRLNEQAMGGNHKKQQELQEQLKAVESIKNPDQAEKERAAIIIGELEKVKNDEQAIIARSLHDKEEVEKHAKRNYTTATLGGIGISILETLTVGYPANFDHNAVSHWATLLSQDGPKWFNDGLGGVLNYDTVSAAGWGAGHKFVQNASFFTEAGLSMVGNAAGAVFGGFLPGYARLGKKFQKETGMDAAHVDEFRSKPGFPPAGATKIETPNVNVLNSSARDRIPNKEIPQDRGTERTHNKNDAEVLRDIPTIGGRKKETPMSPQAERDIDPWIARAISEGKVGNDTLNQNVMEYDRPAEVAMENGRDGDGESAERGAEQGNEKFLVFLMALLVSTGVISERLWQSAHNKPDLVKEIVGITIGKIPDALAGLPYAKSLHAKGQLYEQLANLEEQKNSLPRGEYQKQKTMIDTMLAATISSDGRKKIPSAGDMKGIPEKTGPANQELSNDVEVVNAQFEDENEGTFSIEAVSAVFENKMLKKSAKVADTRTALLQAIGVDTTGIPTSQAENKAFFEEKYQQWSQKHPEQAALIAKRALLDGQRFESDQKLANANANMKTTPTDANNRMRLLGFLGGFAETSVA